MNPAIKVIIIALIALVLALATARFLPPSTAGNMEAYKAAHAELAGRSDLNAEEQARLESLFRKINSKEAVKAEIQEILLRNAAAGVVLIVIGIVAGRLCKLGNNHVFAAGGAIFACFIIAWVPAFGAIAATSFVITALVSQGKKVPPQQA